ncbi:MAG: MerR family transcriptional regulator [Chloroflexi bacterium]|nr:MerR family transcriptional regulator [Chloroflexota bacterium]
MSLTVKQLADLASVSTRTLHYYDEIGILKPSSVSENGYRQYSDEAIVRLQQILFFRELDFSLKEIKKIIDQPEFDTLEALHTHKIALQQRVDRLDQLINTVDKTILHMKGKTEMEQEEFYEGFSEAKQAKYEKEISAKYGDEKLKESQANWKSYSDEKKKAIIAQGNGILASLKESIPKGIDSPDVQKLIKNLHEHMGNFYVCSYEMFLGLGNMYNQDPKFINIYQSKYHEHMPVFLEKAIEYYCEDKISS